MKSTDIRSRFLDFFKSKNHTIVAGSSLVPADDPTLLFTNAGMNQFKNVFLGRERLKYTRAVTAQRCVRAGGKHNDLENVGYTARHHTLFEMLGNFSFGDYFKREAIKYAWEFLTVEMGLPAEKLWITVYRDDAEAEDIWLKEIKVNPDRFGKLGEEDNFWSMGDTGPCGPCSEIFYDHGADIPGDPPGGANAGGDRYIEIWNMVFMQYNRTSDGEQLPLPAPSVDTGMGLERLSAIMQGVHNNYEIDSFQHILNALGSLSDNDDTTLASMRVIADHIRSCSFLIADGVLPANEGRGYTLRRIIRRACRHGHKLGVEGTFFHKLVPAVIEAMGDAAERVKEQQTEVMHVLQREEEQFNKTLHRGMQLLEFEIEHKKNTPLHEDGMDVCLANRNKINGTSIFKLYDTFGFPVDLINDVAREHGFTLDMEGYERCMAIQKERARAAGTFAVDYNDTIDQTDIPATQFTGYEHLEEEAVITGIFISKDAGGKKSVEQIKAHDEAVLVFDKTPFYAESGGQIGDEGLVKYNNQLVFKINKTQKSGQHHLHTGSVTHDADTLSRGQKVTLCVYPALRKATAANHSATHLLHAALREVLGTHVQQKGSLVTSLLLRFDFSHPQALTDNELVRIEQLVNKKVCENTPVEIRKMSMKEAENSGAIALFGEKYGDTVRVLSMGTAERIDPKTSGNNFSVELCGGTHVARTGDIGTFIIISEASIGAGVRRIEAKTGTIANEWIRQNPIGTVNYLADKIKCSKDKLLEKVPALHEKNKELEKKVQQLQQKLASVVGSDLASQAVDIEGVRVLVANLGSGEARSLRETVDQLKNKLGKGVILLAIENSGKISLAAGVTTQLTKQIHAGELLKMVAAQIGGQGGGRPDFAQGGGSDMTLLPKALASVEAWVKGRL